MRQLLPNNVILFRLTLKPFCLGQLFQLIIPVIFRYLGNDMFKWLIKYFRSVGLQLKMVFVLRATSMSFLVLYVDKSGKHITVSFFSELLVSLAIKISCYLFICD